VNYAQRKDKQLKCAASAREANYGSNNIEGILIALRYLSLEAEGAGLIDLANTLESAARQCGKYIGQGGRGYEGS
jgi:hypothetical protein